MNRAAVRLEHLFPRRQHIVDGITAVDPDLSHRGVDAMEGEVDFEEVLQRKAHVLIEPAAGRDDGTMVKCPLSVLYLHTALLWGALRGPTYLVASHLLILHVLLLSMCASHAAQMQSM